MFEFILNHPNEVQIIATVNFFYNNKNLLVDNTAEDIRKLLAKELGIDNILYRQDCGEFYYTRI